MRGDSKRSAVAFVTSLLVLACSDETSAPEERGVGGGSGGTAAGAGATAGGGSGSANGGRNMGGSGGGGALAGSAGTPNGGNGGMAGAPPVPPGPGQRWMLTFSEEFDGTDYDHEKLSPCFDWNYGACTSSFNRGREHYDPEQVVVSDGTAKLIAEQIGRAHV